MAKQRVKKIPFSNIAMEVSTGVWEFSVGSQKWRWMEVSLSPNFGPLENGEWYPQLYIRDLKQAAMFAEGFYARNQRSG